MNEQDEKIAFSAQIQTAMIERLSALNSDLKNSLEKQKQLTELKSRFVSITSHEFRTPLTTIQTNIELLMYQMQDESPAQKEKKSKYFNRILEEIKRLTDLMNDILMLGRLDSEKLPFNPSATSIIDLCKEIIDERLQQGKGRVNVDMAVRGQNNLYWIDLFTDTSLIICCQMQSSFLLVKETPGLN